MDTGAIILFVICAAALIGGAVALWRYWDGLTRVSPEEEAYDRRVAQLNERQANRLSDDDLRRAAAAPEPWKLMVERGRRARQRNARYGGDLQRRRPRR